MGIFFIIRKYDFSRVIFISHISFRLDWRSSTVNCAKDRQRQRLNHLDEPVLAAADQHAVLLLCQQRLGAARRQENLWPGIGRMTL